VYKQIRDGGKPQLGNFFSRLCFKCRATILNIGDVLAGLGAYLLTPELMMGLPITLAGITVLVVFAAGMK
jgi:hypothetical protein